MIGVSSMLAACLFSCSGCSSGSEELKCRVMEVEGGYGYVVLCGSDTLISQPYMPAIAGRIPFSTKEDALNTGKLVCKKLFDGQPPTLSREEVEGSITSFSFPK